MIYVHPVSSFREHLNHEFLVLCPPSPHDRLRIRVDDRLDIVHDVLLLPTLVVKGHPTRGQRFEDISYVNFWATRDTYTKIWKTKLDEFLHELKHAFARRLNPGGVWRLIECVNNQVGRRLLRKCEHFFQAFGQNGITRLVLALVMSRIKTR